MCSLYCAVCIVPFELCNVQLAVYSIMCPVPSVQCVVWTLQYEVYSVQFSVCCVQCAVCSVQCSRRGSILTYCGIIAAKSRLNTRHCLLHTILYTAHCTLDSLTKSLRIFFLKYFCCFWSFFSLCLKTLFLDFDQKNFLLEQIFKCFTLGTYLFWQHQHNIVKENLVMIENTFS